MSSDSLLAAAICTRLAQVSGWNGAETCWHLLTYKIQEFCCAQVRNRGAKFFQLKISRQRQHISLFLLHTLPLVALSPLVFFDSKENKEIKRHHFFV